jgi:hypothetical protein
MLPERSVRRSIGTRALSRAITSPCGWLNRLPRPALTSAMRGATAASSAAVLELREP